ncbi:hypothetical protein Hte_009784 [Hypoxylon texense]
MANYTSMASQLQLPQLNFDEYPTPVTPETLQAIPMLDPSVLATAFSQGFDVGAVESYIQRFPRHMVSSMWDQVVHNHRVFTYAIDTGDVDIIKLCLEHGADVNAVDFGNISVLSFAILRGARVGHSTPEITRLLLSYGADPEGMNKEWWQNYLETPAITDPAGSASYFIHPELALALDLTTRYYLWRASHLEARTKRTLQIAEAHGMTALLRLPYHIVGQEATVRLVVNTVYAHVAQDTAKPLVLAFAGLSGHGKTELATQMGELLSIPTKTIDCAQASDQWALLGSTYGYIGSEKGAPLNEFLVSNKGKRCVVFLDEFDKTTDDVHKALLKVMDEGIYVDRRSEANTSELDCTKVIWILATNYGDTAISRFYDQRLANCKPEEVDKVSIEPLQTELEELFVTKFSAAVTGRIDEIFPFFPFNPGEQAVVAHKFLKALQDKVHRPIIISTPNDSNNNSNNNETSHRLIGHTDIRALDDGRVCAEIARKSYRRDLGARSVYRGVRRLGRDLALRYSDTDDLVDEAMNARPRQQYFAQVGRLPGGGGRDVVVVRQEARKRKRVDGGGGDGNGNGNGNGKGNLRLNG